MKKFFLVIVCLLLLGCRHTSSEQKQAVEESIIVNSDIEQINLASFDENSVIKYSEVFDNIRFVKLETNDRSLIGRIDKIVTTEDKIIILDGSIAKMVFVFDKNGNFLNRVGTNGKGPEEYDVPDDIVYDKYNDELIIWCSNRKTIIRFKLDGTFIGNIKTDRWASSITVVDKNVYLLYLNNISQKKKSSDRCNLLIIGEKGEILSTLSPSNIVGKLSPPAKHAFSFYHDEIIFSPYYFNIIYKLKNSYLEEKYIIDFGKHSIPSSFLKNITSKELRKKIKDNKYAFNIGSIETNTHVISQFVYKEKIFDSFYCKKTKATKVSSVYFNDMYALSSNRTFNYIDSDSIISHVDPQSFIIFQNIMEDAKNGKSLNNLLINKFIPSFSSLLNTDLRKNFEKVINSSNINLSPEEIDFINNIKETDNPIIWIASLKEF